MEGYHLNPAKCFAFFSVLVALGCIIGFAAMATMHHCPARSPCTTTDSTQKPDLFENGVGHQTDQQPSFDGNIIEDTAITTSETYSKEKFPITDPGKIMAIHDDKQIDDFQSSSDTPMETILEIISQQTPSTTSLWSRLWRLCKDMDHYNINENTRHSSNTTHSSDLNWWGGAMNFGGGIPFWLVACPLGVIISIAFYYLCQRLFPCWQKPRLDGNATGTQTSPKKTYLQVVTSIFTIVERAVGQDGATYLWFIISLMVVFSWNMVSAVILIVLHVLTGDKHGPEKHISSTTLSNIGVEWYHLFFYLIGLAILCLMMYLQGQKRNIRSLATPNIPDKFRNRRWLMITGLPLETTPDSLFEYLKRFRNSEEICVMTYRDGIKLVYDHTKLWSVLDELKFLRDVKQTLVTSEPEKIQSRWFDFFNRNKDENLGNDNARNYYSKREESLLARKEEIERKQKFTGTAFVGFNSPADAKATLKALKACQQDVRCRSNCFEDNIFRPSTWSVEYAPPPTEINWRQFKAPMPFWKNLAIWVGISILYMLFVLILVVPGPVVKSLYLVTDSTDHVWDVWILPILFFLGKHILNIVVNCIVDKHRNHQSKTNMELGIFNSNFISTFVIYLAKMLLAKPLAKLLITGQFTYWEISLNCLFLPEHGSFITCAIIFNTATSILMHHTRLRFLFNYIKFLFIYIKKCVFTFRSNAEKITWWNRNSNLRLEFDFASNYAELTCNFWLTILLSSFFPVIGVVMWVCCICRFLSDKAAMVKICTISTTSPKMHRKPIDMAIYSLIFPPVALFVYQQIIQLGNESVAHLLGITGFMSLGVAICCALCLIVVLWRFYWPQMIRLRQWFGYPINEEEEEEEDVVDFNTIFLHEYDPISQMQTSLVGLV
ncbi:hypothetical protein DAPPUDRAFT_106592 [Daphnia pulex]|uniref:CSC1/OSCA1-like cytosolic domain-containing protein n=1 Tax=Daphnia pulex TaxID=6669 RepID=E9GU75_DAPPU|nr:hypothetical protein DAPPUDRAFT_106592 [Daphnia pulex]|eukprot:EFX76984.1 hypothetical protein DAPPUDRAFT_106592 [Daphnia pulex]